MTINVYTSCFGPLSRLTDRVFLTRMQSRPRSMGRAARSLPRTAGPRPAGLPAWPGPRGLGWPRAPRGVPFAPSQPSTPRHATPRPTRALRRRRSLRRLLAGSEVPWLPEAPRLAGLRRARPGGRLDYVTRKPGEPATLRPAPPLRHQGRGGLTAAAT